jgi:hypothetical protein
LFSDHPDQKGVTGKIAVATASLLALAGLIDAVVAISTKTESLTCSVGISFFWCAPRATIADFAGEWTNKNPESGIVRVRIGQQLDKAAVQIWGRCAPSDCPWGVAFTAASDARVEPFKSNTTKGMTSNKRL